MSKATLAARIFLGLVLLVSGLNGLLHFFKGALPSGNAGLFASIMAQHGYVSFVTVLQVIGCLLLLLPRFPSRYPPAATASPTALPTGVPAS